MNRWAATALVALVVPLVWLLMWLGWRGRARRQADVVAPREPVGEPVSDLVGEPSVGVFEGVYVSTTRHGDWLDRIVAHGLGTRSAVVTHVGPRGVVLDRAGARSVFIPVDDVASAGRTSGMAGKFVEKDGLAVITWRLGTMHVDTGLRLRRAEDTAALVAAIRAIASGADTDEAGSGADSADPQEDRKVGE